MVRTTLDVGDSEWEFQEFHITGYPRQSRSVSDKGVNYLDQVLYFKHYVCFNSLLSIHPSNNSKLQKPSRTNICR